MSYNVMYDSALDFAALLLASVRHINSLYNLQTQAPVQPTARVASCCFQQRREHREGSSPFYPQFPSPLRGTTAAADVAHAREEGAAKKACSSPPSRPRVCGQREEARQKTGW